MLRQHIFRRLHRRGAVIALSGGIDSSVTAALCAHALGAENVLGVLMPEKDPMRIASGSALVADTLGIAAVVQDIGARLAASAATRSPDGKKTEAAMPLDIDLGVVSATNMKQRTRKQI
jgi:NAD+ synthase